MSAGIALACATLSPRIAIIIGAIQPRLLPEIMLPLAVLGLVPLVYAAWIARASIGTTAIDAVRINNPFAIGSALTMAGAITVLSVAIRGAEVQLGPAGTYAVAALSGILDVDAVSVAMASRPGELLAEVAANGILLAVGSNTVAKAAMAVATGTPELGRRCGPVLLLAAFAGGSVFLLTR